MRFGSGGGFLQRPGSDVLAVLLHAYRQTPRTLERVATEVCRAWPQTDLLAPRLPADTFSWADPDRIAADLVAAIDGCWEARREQADGGGYRRIILIGHSMGAVLVRKVWALAHGATAAGTVDPAQARPWASQIDRIVLLAALSRGWMISSALDPGARLLWTIGTAWGNCCRFVLQREPLVFASAAAPRSSPRPGCNASP